MKKLNKFNKSNKKRNIIVIGAFLLIGLILVGISYAVYQKEDEVKFINAKVGSFETSSSDIELAMTLDEKDIATPPNKNGGYYNVTVECDYANGRWDENEWGTIITNISSNRVKCNVSFETLKTRPLSIVELGDYISMTPTSTKYTPSSGDTGCFNDSSCTKNTINPSELNLWRVIRKNSDGTVEIVSEYVSNTAVCFRGKMGYMNLVGGLNTIASQYTNEKYVSKTRHMGYSNQMQNCSSISTTLCPSDTGYETDTNLVQKAIGTLASKTPTKINSSYFIASRYFHSAEDSNIRVRYVQKNGELTHQWLSYNNTESYSICLSIRPILTLKSDIKIISGNGKSIDTAYQIY